MFWTCRSARSIDLTKACYNQRRTSLGACSYIFADQASQAVADKYNWSLILPLSARHFHSPALTPPTVSSPSRYDASDVSRFHAWSAIRFCNTTPHQSATYGSYPKVSIRAVGSLDGRSVFGHGSDASWAVHVLSRLPARPCTKTMLRRIH